MKKSKTDIRSDEYHPQCFRASIALDNPIKLLLLPQIRIRIRPSSPLIVEVQP
jgi:hypothetical protein